MAALPSCNRPAAACSHPAPGSQPPRATLSVSRGEEVTRMSITLERTQTPIEVRPPVERPPAAPEQRIGPRVLIAIVVLAAVVAGLVTALVVTGGEEAAEPSVQAQAIDEGDELRRLVNEGYIPKEAFDAQAYWTEWAQVHGFVPTHAVAPALLTREELLMEQLAANGLIPEEALDHELRLTERFVNEGLIPAETVR
jgi:hypothetical protein